MEQKSTGCLKILLCSFLFIIIGVVGFYLYIGYQFGNSMENLAETILENSTEIEDVVVIGGGLMGSSTAWELSKNGEKVLLIEQQDSIYTFGSSFGEARISRSLGPKNDTSAMYQSALQALGTDRLLQDFSNLDK